MLQQRVPSRRRTWLAVAFAVLLGVLIAGLVLLRSGPHDRSAGSGEIAEAPRGSASVGADTGASSAAESRVREAADAGEGGREDDGVDLGMDQDMIALRWAQVDLDALRDEMPDNLYWKLGAPTSDPVVERERAEERARWNEAYGKVLSGTASQAEIHAYYDQRARLSADYVEFASRVLEDYADVLPARDVGLLELSLKMHHARLQQMPQRLTEALERKQKQDRLREAWLADEEAFERAQADEAQRALR